MAKSFGVGEALKLIFLPNGELSDIDLSSGNELDVDASESESSHSNDGLEFETENDSQKPSSNESSDEESETANIAGPNLPPANKNKRHPYSWRKTPPNFPDTEFTGGDFKDPPIDLPTPMEYFKMFITQECMEFIADQTNLFAMQKDAKEIKVTTDEVEQFIGVLLLMGLFPCPSYRMYWSNDSRFSSIADVMSRNRFETLLRYIHFNDNSRARAREHPEYDPLFKIRPLLDRLRTEMGKLEPEECQSIDEQIVPFKGRSGLKQYNKNKPHKWGFKIFTRAGTSGIMYDFEVYTGKSMKLEGNLSISGNVVLRLVRDLPGDQNFKIYFDNWFTSVDLIRTLREQNIWAVATIRRDRMGGCQLASDKQLKEKGRGSLDYKSDRDTNIIIVKWYDNKAVHLISSFCGAEPLDTCRRWSASAKQKIDVERPQIVKEYNHHMGGVDLADMLIELYRTDIRSRKWYMRLVFYCFDVAVVNAWLLYRRHMTQLQEESRKTLPLREFRASISHGLILGGKDPIRKRGRPSLEDAAGPPPPTKRHVAVVPVGDVRYDGLSHWPIHVDKKLRCKNCPNGFTRIKCGKCDVGLCLNGRNNCFVHFHMK